MSGAFAINLNWIAGNGHKSWENLYVPKKHKHTLDSRHCVQLVFGVNLLCFCYKRLLLFPTQQKPIYSEQFNCEHCQIIWFSWRNSKMCSTKCMQIKLILPPFSVQFAIHWTESHQPNKLSEWMLNERDKNRLRPDIHTVWAMHIEQNI